MNKKSMTVSEVATLADMTPDAVRYYSRIGLIKPQKNRKNGYKLYDENDMFKLVFIRKAKQLAYTLKEIKKILCHATAGTSPCPMVRKIIEGRIEENRQRLAGITAMQVRMESAVEKWKKMPDGIPDGDSVCVLIESFVHDMEYGNGHEYKTT